MLVHIAMFTFFITGLHDKPGEKGCYMTTTEKNTEYSTGMSCGHVMNIIDLQYKQKKTK